VILFYVSISAAIKQFEQLGYVSTPLIFMCLAHWLYVNACQKGFPPISILYYFFLMGYKGEELIPTTWDIFYEKWGFMLIFWNFAGVPFTYCMGALYLLKAGPFSWSTSYTVFCFALLLSGIVFFTLAKIRLLIIN
jgi:delta24(24(1))-sterol reductase